MKCIVESCVGESSHNHHIVPTSLDKDSRETIPLCEKHHNILHNMLPTFFWNQVTDKEKAKGNIINSTSWFIKNFVDKRGMRLLKEAEDKNEKISVCPKCGTSIDREFDNLDVYDCPNCSESFTWSELDMEVERDTDIY